MSLYLSSPALLSRRLAALLALALVAAAPVRGAEYASPGANLLQCLTVEDLGRGWYMLDQQTWRYEPWDASVHLISFQRLDSSRDPGPVFVSVAMTVFDGQVAPGAFEAEIAEALEAFDAFALNEPAVGEVISFAGPAIGQRAQWFMVEIRPEGMPVRVLHTIVSQLDNQVITVSTWGYPDLTDVEDTAFLARKIAERLESDPAMCGA